MRLSVNSDLKQQKILKIAGEYQFHPSAERIVIFDRRGMLIWQKQRQSPAESISWDGKDYQGQTVEIGEYICKIFFSNARTVYVPFIFEK